LTEALKAALFEKQLAELDKLSREHEAHLQAARMELERAVEISKQKVGPSAGNFLITSDHYKTHTDSYFL